MSRWFMLPLAAALAGGCQTYQAQPLDSESVLRSWRERSNAIATTPPSTRPAGVEPRVLGMSDAEALALMLNPTLRTARLEARVAQVTADEAGRWGDPSIGIDLERIISGADDPWVIGGLVNLSIPLSGRLGIEKQLAAADAQTALWHVLWQERQTIADLRRAWVEWVAASQRVRIQTAHVEDLTRIDTSIQRLVTAGEIAPTDARLITIGLVRQRLQLLDATRDANRFEAQIRQLIGLTPDAPISLAGDLSLPDDSTDAPDPQSHPRLLAARAEYAAAERSLELEIRRQYPDVDVGGGFGSEEGDRRVLGGVSVPIPVLNANRRAIAEARARRDVVRAAYEADLLALVADRAAARESREAAESAVAAIERDLVPLVDRQVSEAKRLLEAGEFTPLVVREAVAAAADAQTDLVAARRAVAIARVEQLLLTETATPAAQVTP